jgi:hypothetical protein
MSDISRLIGVPHPSTRTVHHPGIVKNIVVCENSIPDKRYSVAGNFQSSPAENIFIAIPIAFEIRELITRTLLFTPYPYPHYWRKFLLPLIYAMQ